MSRKLQQYSTHRPFIRTLFCLGLLTLVSGCTLLFGISFDPAGLPCRIPDETDSRECLAGYTCVDGTCVRAAAKGPGEDCSQDSECEDGLVCRDQYFQSDQEGVFNCDDYLDSSNCSLGRNLHGQGAKCRQTCEPGTGHSECADGQRCFSDLDDEISGFCQGGVCGASVFDCGQNQLCLDNTNDDATAAEGGSGLCYSECDPLQCNRNNTNISCDICPTNDDLNGDGIPEVFGCEPFNAIEAPFICLVAGNQTTGETCDYVSQFCSPGNFCQLNQGQAQGICRQYCNADTGSPACDGAATCNRMQDRNGQALSVGYCSSTF